jgi:hypothetical protein
MGDLFSRVTSFFTLTKTFAVTVPGMILAGALALILWPPDPVDEIMVRRASPGVNSMLALARTDTCAFDARPLPQARGASIDVARDNQQALERARAAIVECIAIEVTRLGNDSANIADLQYQITVSEKERDSLQSQYLRYAGTRSVVARQHRAAFDAVMASIGKKQDSIRALRDNNRETKRRIALDSQYLATTDERLRDPGRLRPRKTVLEIWNTFTDHVIAFLVLSIVLGYAIEPLNTAVFGGLFDRLSEFWNRIRKRRFQVRRPQKNVPVTAIDISTIPPTGSTR